MGSKILFFTATDTLNIEGVLIRFGAVGIFNVETQVVSFRPCDICGEQRDVQAVLFTKRMFESQMDKVMVRDSGL